MSELAGILYRCHTVRGAALTVALVELLATKSFAQPALVAHSQGGKTAWAVVHERATGESTSLDVAVTEVWVAEEGVSPRRLRTFPGRPEGIAWHGDRLYYEARGLTLSLLAKGGRGDGLKVGLVPGGLWAVALDGGEETAIAEKQGQGERDKGKEYPLSPGEGDTADAETLPDTLRAAPGSGVQRAMAAMVDGMSLAMMAYSGAQWGDSKSASVYYRRAADRFEGIPSEIGEAGMSKAACRSCAEALRLRGKANGQEMGRSICLDHLRAIGGFLEAYATAHRGQFPTDLMTLKSWVERQYVLPYETGQGAVAQTFRSPMDTNAGQAVSYGYRPPQSLDGDGTPVAWSLFYPGRIVELVRAGDGFRVIDRTLGQVQLDSLLNVGLCALEVDSLTGAVAALEAVTRVAPSWAQAYAKLGYARLKAGDLDRAEASFQKAINLDRKLAEAHNGMGLVFTKRRKGLYTAIGHFQRALKWDPKYVEARYHMAEARLKMEEHDARQEAERVIALDPTYAPAYRLLGEWYEEQQEDYENAALWYTRYMSLKPDDLDARVRLGRVYLKTRDFERTTQVLMDYVQQHLEDVQALPILAQACLEMRRLDWALTFFKRYVEGIDPKERALYEDIRLVAYPEEMAEYEAVTMDVQREVFLKRFWARRDPDLLTEVNERLIEHYRRVWYARQNFSKGKQPWDRRGEVYIRFGEPDYRSRSAMINLSQSLEVQRVKERMARDIYGEVESLMTYFGPVYPVRGLRAKLSETPDMWTAYPPNQQFLEQRVESKERSLVLQNGPSEGIEATKHDMGSTQRGSSGEGYNAEALEKLQSETTEKKGANVGGPGRSTIRESMMSASQFDDHPDFHPVSVQEDASQVPWESWVYTNIGGGIEITFTDERGIGDFDYAPPPLDAHISLARMNKFNRYAPQRVFERAAAVTMDHYMPRIDTPPLKFYYDVADFRGTQEGRSALEVYYGIPHMAGRYFPEQDSTRMIVERQVALLDLETGATYRTQSELVFQGAGDMTRQQGAFVPDVARLEVPPGRYRMEVSARDRLSGRMGVYRQDVEVNNYAKGRLRLSSLELAWQVSEGQEKDKFTKRGIQVVPLPTRTFRKGQNIFVYYEVYNLKRDASGLTRHTVEYTVRSESGGIFSKIARTFVGRKLEVTVSQGQAGTEEAEYRDIELNLKGLSAGKGLLTVVVKDLNSGEAVARELVFTMAE